MMEGICAEGEEPFWLDLCTFSSRERVGGHRVEDVHI